MLVGLVVSAIILWTVDYSTNKQAAKGIVFLILFFIANYASTWGAVASWIIPSEVFPIRVRGKAIGLATMGNWAANVIVAFLTPILIRPDVANVSGTFMFYAAMLFIALPFVLFLVPGKPCSSSFFRWIHSDSLTLALRSSFCVCVCLIPLPKETKGVPLEEMEEKFSKPLGEHIKSSLSDTVCRKRRNTAPAPAEDHAQNKV